MPHIIPEGHDTPISVETLDDVIAYLSPSFGPEGYATRRSINSYEVTDAFEAIESRNPKKRVRVYSNAGFAPQTYRYPCQIQFVEASRTQEGDWVWTTGWLPAKGRDRRATTIIVR